MLLLDEPDNYLDVPGKRWLEHALRETPKTVLLVSHDRELLADAADADRHRRGGHVWMHGGGFATYAQARRDRNDRLDELRRRWDEEHAKLKALRSVADPTCAAGIGRSCNPSSEGSTGRPIPCATIVRKIRSADGAPGVLDEIGGQAGLPLRRPRGGRPGRPARRDHRPAPWRDLPRGRRWGGLDHPI